MPPRPLTNFEIRRYYQNEPRFNGIYSGNNLPKKIKDGAHVINLDEYADVGTHWIALYVLDNDAFILTVLVLNTFLKKLIVLFVIKTCKQTYLEYKHMVQ